MPKVAKIAAYANTVRQTATATPVHIAISLNLNKESPGPKKPVTRDVANISNIRNGQANPRNPSSRYANNSALAIDLKQGIAE